ncbi:SLAP domain-containing protein [Lactobacillus sp.]|uniref:SLAP domain-containing protein n=1 Tax=Lactobacillus sp. TaxID=1591 RepID=UPI001993158A|nr:SLAP domain-containing protein [Lactobacillus sp.]MBD5429509.1 SlpX [Lactobacillus sp.]
MNKKIKVIGLTAAALMTLMPVIAPTVPVSADTLSTASTPVTGDSYFTYNGTKLDNNAIAPVGNGIVVKSGQTLGEILNEIQTAVPFHSTQSQTNVTERNLSSLKNLLSHIDGVTVNGDGGNAVVTFDSDTVINTSFELEGYAGSADYININVALTNQSTSSSAPVIKFTYTQDGKENTASLVNQVFQIAKDSKFNPTDFTDSNGNKVQFSATESNTNNKTVKIAVLENTVDTTKAGSYGTVKLSATDTNGQKTTVSYKVLVQPKGVQRKQFSGLYVSGYEITGDSVTQAARLNIYQGETFYVGKDTKILNGITYTRFSTKSQAEANSSSNNSWIATTNLMTKDVEVFNATIMHKSLIYDLDGGSKARTISAYSKRTLQKNLVTINGQKYYKIAGASDFIKATNVTGTKHTLKHNAYIYVTSTRRATLTVLKKGTEITTYGSSYTFKNGKKYYRVEGATTSNKRYVKVENFK